MGLAPKKSQVTTDDASFYTCLDEVELLEPANQTAADKFSLKSPDLSPGGD